MLQHLRAESPHENRLRPNRQLDLRRGRTRTIPSFRAVLPSSPRPGSLQLSALNGEWIGNLDLRRRPLQVSGVDPPDIPDLVSIGNFSSSNGVYNRT